MEKAIKYLVEGLKVIIISLILALFVNITVFEPTSVSGQSMEPTLHEGDRLYVFKTKSLFKSAPDYKDIVIVDGRTDRKRNLVDSVVDSAVMSTILRRQNHNLWVKRVIGKAGDTIKFEDGKVYRNGEELEETYINEQMRFGFDEVVVPEGYIYVMGDNRNHSKDSRIVGPVPLENVLGIVIGK